MDAMILAAGRGERLRPLTDGLPKALVEVRGRTLLEHVARRLVDAGADRLVVNVHHEAGRIEAFVRERDLGAQVLLSHERDAPLETGGGLRAAGPLLRRDAPFFLHNVDVLTDLPLDAMYRHHLAAGPLATLAVMERETSRHLLFDEDGLLGRTDRDRALDLRARAARGAVRALAFAGVHVLAPEILGRIRETGAFSILDPYLRLAGEGERLVPYRVDGFAWLDVGRPEHLARARAGP